MKSARQNLRLILNQIESGSDQEEMGVDQIMELLLNRKSEYSDQEQAENETVDNGVVALEGSLPGPIEAFDIPQIPDGVINSRHLAADRIRQINLSYSLSAVYPMESNKPVIGGLVKGVKKGIRKMVLPCLQPVTESQTVKNAYITQSLNAVLECLDEINIKADDTRVHFQGIINQSFSLLISRINAAMISQSGRIDELQMEMEQWKKEMNCQLDKLTERVIGTMDERIQEVANSTANEIGTMDERIQEVVNSTANEIGTMDERIQEVVNSTAKEIDSLRREVRRQDVYDAVDYAKLEKAFRGSEQEIKGRQEDYISYLKGKKKVIDLGCGRGEFLQLLQENGVPAAGVDIYDKFVKECEFKGLEVYKSDALSYVHSLPDLSVDGIVAFQLVEHIRPGEIAELCNTAYQKLVSGGVMILETPNPCCLSTFTNAFYLDSSHDKPIHPLLLKYFVENAGFSDVQIVYTEGSKVPYRLPLLSVENAGNLAEFNDGINALSDLIWGSQDYAVIAIK